MKKLSFLAAVLFAFANVAAQDFNLGVKGGINVASIGGNTYSGLGGLGSKVSFHLGGVAEIPITDKISVQPELLYSSQGTKWNFGTGNDNLKLDYLNLPLFGKISYH